MFKQVIIALTLGVAAAAPRDPTCNLQQCGCGVGGFDLDWCNVDSVSMGNWCAASPTNCGACSGTWCVSGPSEPPPGPPLPCNGECSPWSYECEEGPEYWGILGTPEPDYPECNGILQSPINIPFGFGPGGPQLPDSGIAKAAAASPFASTKTSAGVSAADFTVTQSHGAPKFSCASAGACGSLTREAVSYDLVNLQFHTPSEHTVNGIKFPMELQLMFENFEECQNTDEFPCFPYSTVGVHFIGVVPEEDAICETCFLIDMLFAAGNVTNNAGEARATINLDTLMNWDLGFVWYPGSFTTPPCFEGVNWYILDFPIPIKQSQIDQYYAHIGGFPGNARDAQPLNGRPVEPYEMDVLGMGQVE